MPPPRTGNWRPLLQGDLAARAESIARDIAGELAQTAPEDLATLDRTQLLRRASLTAGRAGQALFLDYFASTLGDERDAATAERFLDEAAEILGLVPTRPGLYFGFTGVAWVQQHLHPQESDDSNAEVDEAVQRFLEEVPWEGAYDLIQGLVGLGVYALERLPNPAAVRALETAVGQLARIAEPGSPGLTWRKKSPEEEGGKPLYDLGLAHGVPGIVAFLSEVQRAGVAREAAGPMIDGAVRWLLAQKRSPEAGSLFPNVVLPGAVAGVSRLAWCYGDLSVAVALLSAARALRRDDWEAEALAVADFAAERTLRGSVVADAGLCHGAFGVAHLFYRLYQATRHDGLDRAARSWFEEGFGMRRLGEALAGFPAWDVTPEGEAGWVPDPGFLTGVAGMGLALLAAISDREPLWDRLLLAAIPPVP